jgi:hypothetical protein
MRVNDYFNKVIISEFFIDRRSEKENEDISKFCFERGISTDTPQDI